MCCKLRVLCCRDGMDGLSVGHIHVRYSTTDRSALSGSIGTASPNTVLKTTANSGTNYTSSVQLDPQHVTTILNPRGVNLTKNATKQTKEKCIPKKHIGFVKVHKAASTSMHIMFYRFALQNNLTPMLFIRDPFPFARFEENLLQFPNKSTLRKFDLMVEHSR